VAREPEVPAPSPRGKPPFVYVTRRLAITTPAACACCFAPPETTFVPRAKKSDGSATTVAWRIPICRRCATHGERHEAAVVPGVMAGIAGMALFGLLAYALITWIDQAGLRLHGGGWIRLGIYVAIAMTVGVGRLAMAIVHSLVPIDRVRCAGSGPPVSVTATLAGFLIQCDHPHWGRRLAELNAERAEDAQAPPAPRPSGRLAPVGGVDSGRQSAIDAGAPAAAGSSAFERLAEEARVQFEKPGLPLDGTLESVARLEAALSVGAGAARGVPDWRPTSAQQRKILRAGAYFGEAIVRGCGARWDREEPDAEDPRRTRVVFGDGTSVQPIDAAFRHVQEGDQAPLATIAQIAAAHVVAPAPPPPPPRAEAVPPPPSRPASPPSARITSPGFSVVHVAPRSSAVDEGAKNTFVVAVVVALLFSVVVAAFALRKVSFAPSPRAATPVAPAMSSSLVGTWNGDLDVFLAQTHADPARAEVLRREAREKRWSSVYSFSADGKWSFQASIPGEGTKHFEGTYRLEDEKMLTLTSDQGQVFNCSIERSGDLLHVIDNPKNPGMWFRKR
jgi:hypothetical protein